MDANYESVNREMAGTSIWLKLKVVLWKNYIIRKRHWFLSLCEVAIPIALFVLIAYCRAKIDELGKHYVAEPSYNSEHSSEEFYRNNFNHESHIYYAPKTEFTTSLIHKVQLKFSLNNEVIRGFSDETQLVKHYQKFEFNNVTMAVIFKDVGNPKHLSYVIRPFEQYTDWQTHTLYNSIDMYIPNSGSDTYIYKSFIAFQMALDTAFIEMTTNKDLPLTLVMQEFPYPPYYNDLGITDMFLYVLPLVTIFSFEFLCPAVLKRIVEEKSTGIKELMKMMGLKSWMLWLGWFLHAFIVVIISVSIITFLMKVALWDAKTPPIEYCSGSLFFVFLLLYSAAGITFCFFISSLFNRPTLAMVLGILAWILTYTIPNSIVENSPNMKWFKKILLGLFPNMALGFGYKAISVYESREIGANWSNLFKSASGGSEDVTMGNVFIMFIIDIIVYTLLTVYIENIKPGPYGLAKPFYFPLEFIRNKITRRSSITMIGDNEEDIFAKEYCKIEETPDLTPGIQVKKLYKNFGKQAAVNGISIDIYEKQITALLGHNGAGKTTTMSIITGMIGASSGQVVINNKNIKYNMDEVRSSLGLCPQHNLQFTDLTVLEHLIFFGMLKGLSKNSAETEAKTLLDRMNMSQKKNSLASSLSGGMRRKLSLGIALIGNSKVLILDEPTSGLDPEARREIWDMLISQRGSRTILITTHFMEEADVLGDRIAIMDHGRLICYGTSMFLKKEYGTGYHLNIIRDQIMYQSTKDDTSKSQVESITEIVKDSIKSAVLQAVSGNYLTFLLPHETKSQFGELLSNLENQKESLGITNINMSVTTLEEVFLRVGSMVAKEDKKMIKNKNDINTGTVRSTTSTESTNSTTSIKTTGTKKIKLQFKSLLRKRFCITKKRWLIYTISVLLAFAITMLTLYLGESGAEYKSDSSTTFDITLTKYGNTKVYYGVLGSDKQLTNMSQYYDKLVASKQGNPQKVASVSEAIINEGIENIEFYKQHMIVAAEFNKTNDGEKIVNAMYSNKAIHGAPIALNLLTNAILKSYADDEYSITSVNNPLPVTYGFSSENASELQIGTLWFILFPLGMLFLSGTFILFPQAERVSNIKQLQLMCGIRSVFYWLSCFIYDLALYIVAVLILINGVLIYGITYSDIFSGKNEIGALFLILLAYGLAVIPFSYLFSYKQTASGGFAFFLIGSLFVSIFTTTVVLVLQTSGDEYYEKIGKTLKYILLIFPQFGLTYTSLQFSRKAVWNHNWKIKSPSAREAQCYQDYNPCCDGYDTPSCVKYRSYFCGNKSITINVIEMASSSVLYFIILLLLETNFVQIYWNKFLVFVYDKMHPEKHKLMPLNRDEDYVDDVDCESKRVFNTLEREKKGQDNHRNDENYDEDLLLVHNVEKIYWGQKVVKGISFGVKAGDCFGLLGVNGAGKTTTFRMLTGDEPLITGEARICTPNNNMVRISKDTKKYLEQVGYCPQFDAINEVLTGREMLRLFAELRGISEGAEEEVNMWLAALGLEEYADKLCGEYSGGNKRKLSMAVALIGSPILVMLDEPTSGVDPVSRRKLWNTLAVVQKQEVKPSILLTSHSMEECEALCNKLSIMKAGRLECYGTVPQLKEKYGQGFTIMLKIKPSVLTIIVNPMMQEDDESTASQSQPLSSVDNRKSSNTKNNDVEQEEIWNSEKVKNVMAEFEEMYKGYCTLRDKHSGLLHYHINDKNKKWGELFQEIENLKQKHPIIEDYNISETTLEEVFLSIARSDKV